MDLRATMPETAKIRVVQIQTALVHMNVMLQSANLERLAQMAMIISVSSLVKVFVIQPHIYVNDFHPSSLKNTTYLNIKGE